MQRSGTTGRTRGRIGLAGVVLSVAGVLAMAFAGGAGAAAPTTSGPTAAGYAGAWLAARLDAQVPMENFGAPDWGVTLDAALGLVAAGAGGDQVDAVWAALVEDREAAVAPGGVDAPGRLARVILLARATGADPGSVGAEPGADMIARLEATRRVAGADVGLFGAGNPTYDGAFRQGYALAALVAVGVTPDPTAVEWLLAQQCGADGDPGAWMPYRSDLSVPCAFDAVGFVGPDTNATAAAITGLAAVGGETEVIDAALDWLDGVQEVDGGWGQMVGFGTDPNSTALVIQALLAVGQADAGRFADQASTPMAALLSYQLGCDVPAEDRGAFTFPGSNDAPNGFATAQAVAPAMGAAVVFDPGEIAAGVVPLDCSESPTSSTSTSTSVVPTTAVPTTATPTSAGPASVESSSTVVVPVAQVAGRSQTATPASATAGSAAATDLARTGAPSTPLALLGGLLTLIGLVLVAGRRRTHTV